MRPPTTLGISGAQSMVRDNWRSSTGFERLSAPIITAETPQVAFSRPIRLIVSGGRFRRQFFGTMMAFFGRLGQAGKPRRRRWRRHSEGSSPIRVSRLGVSSIGCRPPRTASTISGAKNGGLDDTTDLAGADPASTPRRFSATALAVLLCQSPVGAWRCSGPACENLWGSARRR